MDFLQNRQLTPNTPLGGLFWRIVCFVIPGYAVVLLGTVMSAVDKAFVGRVSSLQLASLGPATGAYDCSTFALSFFNQATLALVGSVPAGEDRVRVRSHALVFAASAGAVVGCFFVISTEHVVHAFGASAEMAPHAVRYLRIRALCMVVGRIRDVSNQFCLAEKDVITPFLTTVVAALVNIVGDLLLCQRLGTLGAALATDAASFAACFLVVVRLRVKGDWPLPLRLPSSRDFAPFASYAGALFANNLLKMSAVATMGGFAVRISTVSGAAHQICVTAFMLCGFALGMPMSWAARAFLPTKVEDPEYRRTAAVLLAVAVVASAFGVLTSTFILRGRGLHCFTQDPEVIAEVRHTARYVSATVSLSIFYQSVEGLLVTQQRLRSLVLLGGSLTLAFCVASSSLHLAGLLTLPLLWATLMVGISIISSASAVVACRGLRGAKPEPWTA